MPDLILLPGLMDSHVHLIGNTESKGYESISESSYLDTIYGVENASKTLMGSALLQFEMLVLVIMQMLL